MEEGERVEGAVEEACVWFAVLVAVEGAGCGVLEGSYVCWASLSVDGLGN